MKKHIFYIGLYFTFLNGFSQSDSTISILLKAPLILYDYDSSDGLMRTVNNSNYYKTDNRSVKRLIAIKDKKLSLILKSFPQAIQIFVPDMTNTKSGDIRKANLTFLSLNFNQGRADKEYFNIKYFKYSELPDRLYYCSVNNYNLSLDLFMMNTNAHIINISENLYLDFLPISLSPTVKYFFVDSSYLNSPELLFINFNYKGVNSIFINNEVDNTRSYYIKDMVKSFVTQVKLVDDPKSIDSCSNYKRVFKMDNFRLQHEDSINFQLGDSLSLHQNILNYKTIKKPQGNHQILKIFEANSIRFEAELLDSILDGVVKKYYVNGGIEEERKYDNGQPKGSWKKYDKQGRVICVLTFHKQNKYTYYTYNGNETTPSQIISFLENKEKSIKIE